MDILSLMKLTLLLILQYIKALSFNRCSTYDKERLWNGEPSKSLIRCTHFLTRNHISHTPTFGDLFDLVVNCGGEGLKQFMENTRRNAAYTSKDAVI